MRKFGLIGYPLGHSMSATYFAGKFDKENILDCSYSLYPISNIEKLPELVEGEKELRGLNVTIPYKKDVMEFVDVLDNEALEVGAVNVLKIDRSAGRRIIHGFNSDIAGVEGSILPHYSHKLKKGLILGTGGASKAVAHTLRKMGIEFRFVCITEGEGILKYEEVNPEILDDVQIIINTTPLGMYPDVTSRPKLDYDRLNGNHILFDVVYNPEMTAFLEAGKEMGCKVITGLEMFRLQAERSWEIWNQ